jgi:glutamyl-tRNA reductase
VRELEQRRQPERVLASLARSLTNKLIHSPTVAIRNASADGRTDLLDYLKQLYHLD